MDAVLAFLSTALNHNVFFWWLILEILGLAALPIAFRSMRWLPDRGYAFSKAIGLLIASYLLWMGAMTGFLRNDAGGILFTILAVFGLSAILLRKRTNLQECVNFVRENKRLIFVIELLFTTAFIAWVILRAYAPEKVMSAGGEKFMEMAFLNGVLNSPRFPPMDVWLSGFGISYYYFGYIMMGLLTRLSGAPAGVGFELYDALLLALAIVGVFGVVYNLVANSISERRHVNHNHPKAKKPFIRQPVLYGLLGSLLVVIMGNLEGLLESLYVRGALPESFWRWIDIPGLLGNPVTGGWAPGGGFFGCCWRASRVLQDYDLSGQAVAVSPITEFPLFSFLLGDNHPHVLALPFVLLMAALAFNLLLRQLNVQGSQVDGHDSRFSLRSLLPTEPLRMPWALWLFYAFCLGALGFLNTWDMPIYLGLVTLAYATGEYIRQRKLDWALFLRTFILAASLLFAAILFYLLFYLGFQSQAGGILPYVFKPTRLPQYLVMFGPFIYVLIWFLSSTSIQKAHQDGKKFVIRTSLAAWMWIVLACIALVAFFMLAIFLALGTGQIQNPIVQNLLGGGTINQAIQRFLSARFSNPWLFLMLTGLMGFSLANLLQKNEKAADISSTTTAVVLNRTDSSKMFVFLLILLGVALTLSVEIFYLRDSFGVRMNTIFKFYYQAWIMLGCASAYAIWWLLNPGKAILGSFSRGVFLTSTALLVGAGMIYPLIAGYARADGLGGTPNLDGAANLARSNPDDWAAIAWLRANLPANHNNKSAANHTPVVNNTSVVNNRDVPIILEAPGKSYNYEGRISAFSGFPSLLGWAYHEAQWRGNYDEQGKREPDIQTIYTTKNGDLALELLRKWNVKYVVIGNSEISYIQQLCEEPSRACNLTHALRKFETRLIPVFQQGNTTIYQVPESGQ